jgi:hypothetical protein
MPTSTDLVTDLPADFEVFGQAVDTSLADLKGGTTGQVLKKNSNTDMDFVWGADSAGMTNPMTTTGDTIYSSSGSTPARLGIGTTGQILTVAGGVPTWATAAGGGTSWTLLNAGGTALTGAQTITVSGISGKNKIMVLLQNASSASASSVFNIRLNTDTGGNYFMFGFNINRSSTYDSGDVGGYYDNSSSIPIGMMSSTAASPVVGGITLDGCNTSGIKTYQSVGAGRGQGASGQQAFALQGYYNSASTISSISVYSDAGNCDAGTVFVYTSTN